jgi:hypothetical protein
MPGIALSGAVQATEKRVQSGENAVQAAINVTKRRVSSSLPAVLSARFSYGLTPALSYK